jgi:ATP-dependent helicase/nuclease subunit B
LHVLSFDRLQFLLLGKNTARPQLSRIGQQMIVHRILRDNSSKLKIFRSSANWPGLGRQMAQTITELHQYAKTPEDIDCLLDELRKDERNNLALLKFSDIGLILKEYFQFIEGTFVDPDVQLTRACQAVSKADFVRGAKLWVDGFAGFTTAELAMLTELLKATVDAQIALCLDPSNIDLANPDTEKLESTSLFSPTENTYSALVEIVKKCRLQLAKPMVLKRPVRFSACPQLAHIEREIFSLKPTRIASADNIRIVSAPNMRAEVQFVTRQILELVKEKGYRYRDIAVIASDIESYEHYIRAYFDDYHVPFFIDKRKALNQHPVVQLICSALQVVTGGFSSSDIFAYLKTDLVPIERCEVDLLENYCVAFGINPDDWQRDRPWHFAGKDGEEFDEQRINRIRLKAIGPLLELRDRLCPADGPTKMITPEEFTQIIFDLLDTLQVRQRLGEWIEQAAAGNHFATVDEHRQFYDRLLNVFDELVVVFAGQQMTCQDYLAIVKSTFSQLTLAFIPPTLDQVLVGSIERSRHPDLKAVFLIGATQRQFPAPVSFDSILTDDDRTTAESADFPLAPTVNQKLTERQYLAYIAFTRPSEFLCITYPVADEKGSAVPRSQFIAELEGLFDNLSEESIAGEQIDIEKVDNKPELTDMLCSQLGRDALMPERDDSHELERLLDDICSDNQLAELGSTVASAINYDNSAHLDSGVVEKLFTRRITSSATRLSTFAACPYQYFARYTLELRERKEFKFEPLDVGNFYHRVLDGLLKRLNAAGKDFATVKDEQLLGFLDEEISKFLVEDPFISHFARHSEHNMFVIHSAGEYLEDFVLAMAEMVRAGSFVPRLSEVSFGQDGGVLGDYEVTLADGSSLSLRGKIDRLDIAEIDGETFAIVFDYKRRTQSFNWAKFYHGLDIQLPIYMLAVRNAKNSKTTSAVGAFYLPVEAQIPAAALDELAKPQKFRHKAKGIFQGQFFELLDRTLDSGWSNFYSFRVTAKDGQYGDPGRSAALKPGDFEKVLQFAATEIVKLSEGIVSGKIDVRPYRLNQKSPCSYCKYRPVCRFDWQINDYSPLVSLNKLQVLEKIETVDG